MDSFTSPPISLTSLDFRALQKMTRRRLKRRPALWLTLYTLHILSWIGVGIFVSAYVRLFQRFSDFYALKVGTVVLVVSVCLAVLALIISRQTYRKHLLGKGGVFRLEHTIQVSDAGITVKSEHVRSEFSWGAFVGVEIDPKNYYLFLDESHAIVVPRSSIYPVVQEFEGRLPDSV